MLEETCEKRSVLAHEPLSKMGFFPMRMLGPAICRVSPTNHCIAHLYNASFPYTQYYHLAIRKCGEIGVCAECRAVKDCFNYETRSSYSVTGKFIFHPKPSTCPLAPCTGAYRCEHRHMVQGYFQRHLSRPRKNWFSCCGLAHG